MAPTGGRSHRKGQAGDFGHTVGQKSRRKLRADREKTRSIWMGMGMFGLVGWSIALPTLLGLILGHWLDARLGNGFSWTLALMLAGLTLGVLNVWGWLQKNASETQVDTDGDDEA
ncbi:MAG: AtpZ/AtpI family protein [Bacillota bacterium]